MERKELTYNTVMAIRKMYEETRSPTQVAERFHVAPSTVSQAARGELLYGTTNIVHPEDGSTPPKPKRRTKAELAEAARLANEAGMSYGKWVMQNDKPR